MMASSISFLAARHTSVPSLQDQAEASKATSVSSAAFVQSADTSPWPLYRPAKPLTYELQNHSTVYLEEGQYEGGFTFLNSLLVAGTSISTPEKCYPAFVPQSQVIALAASLIAYPKRTTRTKNPDDINGSNAAYRYLRNVCKIVAPTATDLRSAFTFSSGNSRRRTRGGDADSPGNEGRERLVKGSAANDQSLYTLAEDFWHAVGWAFNCSVRQKKRWERWKLWLELSLDYLEEEWLERSRSAQEGDSGKEEVLKASLIWEYLTSNDQNPTSRGTRRRIMRAILADGTFRPKKEFPEIWKDETLEPVEKDNESMKSPKTFDIEIGEFGDYGLDDDEDETMEDVDPRIPSRSTRRAALARKTPSNNNSRSTEDSEDDLAIVGHGTGVERLGGLDALILRQRLLALLIRVAEALPEDFTQVEDLFDLYTEFFRYIPTTVFASLLNTSTLDPETQMCLNTNLLIPLVSKRDVVKLPSQDDLEKHFLPNSASTHSFSANAKLSLILESIVMILMNAGLLKASSSLRTAMEAGIRAREKALGDARRRKGNADEEEQAKEILGLSSKRLLGLLEVIEIAAGLPPRPRPRKAPLARGISVSSELSSISSMSSDSDNDSDDKE